jgi:hypothetical protein
LGFHRPLPSGQDAFRNSSIFASVPSSRRYDQTSSRRSRAR